MSDKPTMVDLDLDQETLVETRIRLLELAHNMLGCGFQTHEYIKSAADLEASIVRDMFQEIEADTESFEHDAAVGNA